MFTGAAKAFSMKAAGGETRYAVPNEHPNAIEGGKHVSNRGGSNLNTTEKIKFEL